MKKKGPLCKSGPSVRPGPSEPVSPSAYLSVLAVSSSQSNGADRRFPCEPQRPGAEPVKVRAVASGDGVRVRPLRVRPARGGGAEPNGTSHTHGAVVIVLMRVILSRRLPVHPLASDWEPPATVRSPRALAAVQAQALRKGAGMC